MKDVWHDKFRLFPIDQFWNVNNVTYGKVAGQVQFHTKTRLGKWNKTFLPKNKNENNNNTMVEYSENDKSINFTHLGFKIYLK